MSVMSIPGWWPWNSASWSKRVRDSAHGHHPDRDVTVDEARDLVGGLANRGDRRERGACVREHRGPRIGETNRPARAIEQRLAELQLELANLRAHARLADVDPFRGPGEVGGLHHRDEVLELADVHNQ